MHQASSIHARCPTQAPSHLLRRFLAEDGGQDLIEYGLLAGIITTGLIVVLPFIESGIAQAFVGWGTNTNNLWVPNPPGT